MRSKLIALAGLVALVLAVTACSGDPGDQYTEAVSSREQAFERAQALYPAPQTQNFPIRQALVEFTERQDLINHPWYVYTLGMDGNVLGYYVAKTYPINACNFLSSTQKVVDAWDTSVVMTAPSYDGIYYGGAGASSGCDAWFFFDYSTDAMLVIRGVGFYVADQPLALEAEPISIKAGQQ